MTDNNRYLNLVRRLVLATAAGATIGATVIQAAAATPVTLAQPAAPTSVLSVASRLAAIRSAVSDEAQARPTRLADSDPFSDFHDAFHDSFHDNSSPS